MDLSPRADSRYHRGAARGSAALLATAGVVFLAGAALTTFTLVDAVRRWVRQLDDPPKVLLRRRLVQLGSATSAGAAAWRNGSPAGAASSGASSDAAPVPVQR